MEYCQNIICSLRFCCDNKECPGYKSETQIKIESTPVGPSKFRELPKKVGAPVDYRKMRGVGYPPMWVDGRIVGSTKKEESRRPPRMGKNRRKSMNNREEE